MAIGFVFRKSKRTLLFNIWYIRKLLEHAHSTQNDQLYWINEEMIPLQVLQDIQRQQVLVHVIGGMPWRGTLDHLTRQVRTKIQTSSKLKQLKLSFTIFNIFTRQWLYHDNNGGPSVNCSYPQWQIYVPWRLKSIFLHKFCFSFKPIYYWIETIIYNSHQYV